MHIKALAGVGISAVADAKITEMQSRERIRREVIVLVRILGPRFRILELVVRCADGLLFGEW